MITEQDLLGAIAECQGARNPNANTCLKLASYYTILDHVKEREIPQSQYSMASAPDEPKTIGYYGDSEFLSESMGKTERHVMLIMDDLMKALSVLNPKLYASVMRKIAD